MSDQKRTILIKKKIFCGDKKCITKSGKHCRNLWVDEEGTCYCALFKKKINDCKRCSSCLTHEVCKDALSKREKPCQTKKEQLE